MGCGVWMEEECDNMISKKYNRETMDTRTWKEEEEEEEEEEDEEEKEDAQKQGCTISGRLVAQTSIFCTVEPNIFSISTVVFFPLPCRNVRQFTNTDNKRKARFRGHFGIVGPHCGTCVMSPFWRLEFGGAFCLLWKK